MNALQLSELRGLSTNQLSTVLPRPVRSSISSIVQGSVLAVFTSAWLAQKVKQTIARLYNALLKVIFFLLFYVTCGAPFFIFFLSMIANNFSKCHFILRSKHSGLKCRGIRKAQQGRRNTMLFNGSVQCDKRCYKAYVARCLQS